MANPRNVLVRDGIGYRAGTYKIDGVTILFSAAAANGSVSAGLAVGLVVGGTDTVELVTTGQAILGRLDTVEPDGGCSVQIEGQCYLPQGSTADCVEGGKIVGALSTAARGYIGPATGDVAGAIAGRHRVDNDNTATAIDVYLGA